MRVGLLISGYLRSFESTIENLQTKIIDKFNNIDVYIHITQNEKEDDRYLNKIEFNLLEKIQNQLKPKCILLEPNIEFDENNKQKNTIFNQWLKFYRLNQIKKFNETLTGVYDILIKTRPDFYLNSELNFEECIVKKKIIIPSDSKIDQKKLSQPDDQYLCDIFAYGPSELMDLYFELYTNLEYLTENKGFVSETLLYHHLEGKVEYELRDIDYYVILSNCNVFAICGDSGSGKSTLGNLLSRYFDSSFVLEGDRYHKWERDNMEWKKFTHLNPEANYITKMNQDIFDLKIGKSIYQVDYDHSNGKFTPKQKIENSENIIVCGLHSLYTNNNQLYNLRIFMDTDEELRKKWKIKRDTEKRGYSIEKILDQIITRKEDYLRYIYPQKDNSNVIVNFYENQKQELNLKIKILKDLITESQISHIIENFKGVELTVEDNFFVFNFLEYIDHVVLESLKYRNYDFYDYITYLILNLESSWKN